MLRDSVNVSLPGHKAGQPFLYMQLTIYMQLSGTKYACTRSTFAIHVLSVEERLGKSEIAKIDLSHFGPKTAKI